MVLFSFNFIVGSSFINARNVLLVFKRLFHNTNIDRIYKMCIHRSPMKHSLYIFFRRSRINFIFESCQLDQWNQFSNDKCSTRSHNDPGNRLMLVHGLRHWPNIITTLGERLVLAQCWYKPALRYISPSPQTRDVNPMLALCWPPSV